MISYVFIHHGAEVRATHRSMADMVSLPDALASVGFRCTYWASMGNSQQS